MHSCTVSFLSAGRARLHRLRLGKACFDDSCTTQNLSMQEMSIILCLHLSLKRSLDDVSSKCQLINNVTLITLRKI